jgi:hypothetical protein
LYRITLRTQIWVDVGGILSDTIVITTDNNNKIVRAKPIFSPLSTGRINTNGGKNDNWEEQSTDSMNTLSSVSE